MRRLHAPASTHYLRHYLARVGGACVIGLVAYRESEACVNMCVESGVNFKFTCKTKNVTRSLRIGRIYTCNNQFHNLRRTHKQTPHTPQREQRLARPTHRGATLVAVSALRRT